MALLSSVFWWLWPSAWCSDVHHRSDLHLPKSICWWVMQRSCCAITSLHSWSHLTHPHLLPLMSPTRIFLIFTLTGRVFLLIPSHFAHTQMNRSLYSLNHLSCDFNFKFIVEASQPNRWAPVLPNLSTGHDRATEFWNTCTWCWEG